MFSNILFVVLHVCSLFISRFKSKDTYERAHTHLMPMNHPHRPYVHRRTHQYTPAASHITHNNSRVATCRY